MVTLDTPSVKWAIIIATTTVKQQGWPHKYVVQTLAGKG